MWGNGVIVKNTTFATRKDLGLNAAPSMITSVTLREILKFTKAQFPQSIKMCTIIATSQCLEHGGTIINESYI